MTRIEEATNHAVVLRDATAWVMDAGGYFKAAMVIGVALLLAADKVASALTPAKAEP